MMGLAAASGAVADWTTARVLFLRPAADIKKAVAMRAGLCSRFIF